MLGTIQATEVLKVITGVGEPLYNRLLSFDAKSMNFRTVKRSQRIQDVSSVAKVLFLGLETMKIHFMR